MFEKTYEDMWGNKVNVRPSYIDSREGVGSDGRTYYLDAQGYRDWSGGLYQKSLFDTPDVSPSFSRSYSDDTSLSEDFTEIMRGPKKFMHGLAFLTFFPITIPYVSSKFILDRIRPNNYEENKIGNRPLAGYITAASLLLYVNLLQTFEKPSSVEKVETTEDYSLGGEQIRKDLKSANQSDPKPYMCAYLESASPISAEFMIISSVKINDYTLECNEQMDKIKLASNKNFDQQNNITLNL